jgi:hypothetical protein
MTKLLSRSKMDSEQKGLQIDVTPSIMSATQKSRWFTIEYLFYYIVIVIIFCPVIMLSVQKSNGMQNHVPKIITNNLMQNIELMEPNLFLEFIKVGFLKEKW